MERNIFEKQRELNDRLNRYRDEYYNRNAPSVSDEVYDRLFDELKELEQETGIQMANSPMVHPVLCRAGKEIPRESRPGAAHANETAVYEYEARQPRIFGFD